MPQRSRVDEGPSWWSGLAKRVCKLLRAPSFPGAWLLEGPWRPGSWWAWVASHGMDLGAWRGRFQGAKVSQAVHGPRDPVRAGTQVPSLHKGASCQGIQGRSITLRPGWLAHPGTQGVKRPWHQGTNMPRRQGTELPVAPRHLVDLMRRGTQILAVPRFWGDQGTNVAGLCREVGGCCGWVSRVTRGQGARGTQAPVSPGVQAPWSLRGPATELPQGSRWVDSMESIRPGILATRSHGRWLHGSCRCVASWEAGDLGGLDSRYQGTEQPSGR